MDIIINPDPQQLRLLCQRNRASDDARVTRAVSDIIDEVKSNKDQALRALALRYDGVELDQIRLDRDYLEARSALVPAHVRRAINKAAQNIRTFHEAQRMQPIVVEVADGVVCQQRQVPIQRVGLYVPGGQAPLFSTVLMLAVPASIAGCREVVLCTPYVKSRGISPEIAYAALSCGIDHIYAVGGAQAIAAMALGTETIPKVDKIFGPGNRYVTKAKQLVSGWVAIDMLAGPSEVMVMADSTADPAFVASDLLSQAEHGADSQAMMVTNSVDMAQAVMAQVMEQKSHLSRQQAVEGSLSASHLIVLESVDRMIEFANMYAAEHLIISMASPWTVAERITSAGSVFIGNYSPESAGDYASGTNHTLPTSGLAHAFSGVNLDSYMKKITYQEITPGGLAGLADAIIPMAEAEGLEAHAAAVKIRISKQ